MHSGGTFGGGLARLLPIDGATGQCRISWHTARNCNTFCTEERTIAEDYNHPHKQNMWQKGRILPSRQHLKKGAYKQAMLGRVEHTGVLRVRQHAIK